MLDDKSNVRDEMIDAYLREALPDEDRAQVELWMLEDPEFYERVRQAELMRQSFSGSEQADSPVPRGTQHKPVKINPMKVSFRQWIVQPMSMAASLLLVVAATLLVSNEMLSPGSTGMENGLAVNAVTTLQPTRGGANQILLTGEMHLLQIDVGISVDDASYQVELIHESGNPQFEFQLQADSNGMVRLVTPADIEGQFVLSVHQLDSEQSPHVYQILFND